MSADYRAAKFAGAFSAPDEPTGPGEVPIGNRIGERDPRGMYGENQTVPTNIYGERPVKRDPHVRQFIPNQLPDREQFELPPERGPFGVLARGQTPDKNLILGENTMGHHIGSELRPGAGLPGAQFEPPPHILPDKAKAMQFDQQLAAYDEFAANIERNLLELRALNPHRFDNFYQHLRRVNLPRSKPDPNISAGFTTMEAALAKGPTSATTSLEGCYSPYEPPPPIRRPATPAPSRSATASTNADDRAPKPWKPA